MKEETTAFKARIQTCQMRTLVIQVFLMVIGGCVFGLGVVTRPILRITKPEFSFHVEWILDMMVATGLAQLATAGLDCFAACWKLIWLIYLGIGLTSMTICLELGALGTSLQLLHQADVMANEQTIHSWYWVECQDTGTCHDAMLSYIHSYVLPQIVLVAIAIFLQGLGIMYLGKLVRSIADHQKMIENYREWYKEHYERPEKTEKRSSKKSSKKLDPPINLEEDDDADKVNSSEGKDVVIPDPDYNSPSSILKDDHGYVAASGGSLDYDDSYMKNKNTKDTPKEIVQPTQSISFNANVQVHFYDAKENLQKSSGKKKSKKSSMKSTSQVRLIPSLEEETMNDLTPETIQLQESSANLGKGESRQQHLDFASVASNLTKLLAGDSPETLVSSGPEVMEMERKSDITQLPQAPPSTPLYENVTFNFSPVPLPNITVQKDKSPTVGVEPKSPMPSTSTTTSPSSGSNMATLYNPKTSFTHESFD